MKVNLLLVHVWITAGSRILQNNILAVAIRSDWLFSLKH
jgi:hypothetical protein